MGAIDLDEIERRIPSPATECSYCRRLATLACPACRMMTCEDHRDTASRTLAAYLSSSASPLTTQSR